MDRLYLREGLHINYFSERTVSINALVKDSCYRILTEKGLKSGAMFPSSHP